MTFVKEQWDENTQNTNSFHLRNRSYNKEFSVLGNGKDFSQRAFELRDIGTPPLTLFIMLVSLFMFVIGPVSYFYLRRHNRLAYQLWVVPVLSAITCLTLLGFNLIREGVTTKVRTIALVHLDQKLNRAAAYTHRSIYSALRPGRYQFDFDSLAVVQRDWDEPNRYSFDSENYTIRSNLARPRTVHQIFEARPLTTTAGLEKKTLPDGQGVSIKSKFSDEIRLLVFKKGNQFFTTEKLAPEQEVVLKPLTEAEAMNQAADWFQTGMIENKTDYHAQTSRINRFNRRNNRGLEAVAPKSVGKINYLRNRQGVLRNIDDDHYLAIFETYSELGSPVKNAKQIDGSIFVHGKW